MSDKEIHSAAQRLPYKKKLKNHTVVKDNDLQIHIPTIKDANLSHRALRFKVPYSSKLPQAESLHVEGSSAQVYSQGEDLKLVMEEAENSYDSMMQIRQQLHQAYKEFMQLQS